MFRIFNEPNRILLIKLGYDPMMFWWGFTDVDPYQSVTIMKRTFRRDSDDRSFQKLCKHLFIMSSNVYIISFTVIIETGLEIIEFCLDRAPCNI